MRISDWSSDVCSSDLDQVADVRMARMHRQLIAVFDDLADRVDVGKIELRSYALRIQIQRQIDDVKIAGALAIAEQRAFDAIGAGHQRKLAGGSAGAAIVVRMHRQDDRIALGDRSEEHTSALQSLMRLSYGVFCLKKKT